MKKIFRKPNDAWVGDLIPYYENGVFYIYYLHDPRTSPNKYAEQTTWYMSTTKDFCNFEDHGIALQLGDENDNYRNCYTGSILKDRNNIYHAFFTGFNPDEKIDGEPLQSVMVARGESPFNLKVDKSFRLLADGDTYDKHDWRDPFVFFNEEENCYWMLICSRLNSGGYHRSGCIALCKSDDLINWEYSKPLYSPNSYIALECPEIFKLNGYYYLIFSTFSDKFATHYLVSKSMTGPWKMMEEDSLDTRVNYAIKSTSDGQDRYAFSWIATKTGQTDYGDWEWGGELIVNRINQNPQNGELSLVPTTAMLSSFENKIDLAKSVCVNANFKDKNLTSEGLGAILWDLEETDFLLECEFTDTQCHEFGLFFNTDTELENGYQLRFVNNTMSFDLWPRVQNEGIYQWQIKGDIPFQIETLRTINQTKNYQLKIVREGSIVVVYVNCENVLTYRLYNQEKGKIGVYIVNGALKIKNFTIKRKKEKK